MVKGLGILLGGVFIGAIGVELVHKKCPDILSKLCSKTCDVASGAKDAFKKGYEAAVQPQ